MATVALVIVLMTLEQRSPGQSAPPPLTLVADPPPKAGPSIDSPKTPLSESDEKEPPPPIKPETLTFYETLAQSGKQDPAFKDRSTKSSTPSLPGGQMSSPLHNTEAEKSSRGERRYTIQVAAIKDPSGAKTLAARLKQKGYTVFIVPHLVPNRGTWYRVLKKFDPEAYKILHHQLKKRQTEVRGERFPLHEPTPIRLRNARLQRLHNSIIILEPF